MGDLAEAAASELSAAESYPKIHPNLPKRLIPVFLDKTNLTPGYLDEGLRSEVQSAKHLIVICSRSAQAKSKYLDNEIQYFLDGGGTPDRIIPFIVDYSKRPVEECFPGRLRALNDVATICCRKSGI